MQATTVTPSIPPPQRSRYHTALLSSIRPGQFFVLAGDDDVLMTLLQEPSLPSGSDFIWVVVSQANHRSSDVLGRAIRMRHDTVVRPVVVITPARVALSVS